MNDLSEALARADNAPHYDLGWQIDPDSADTIVAAARSWHTLTTGDASVLPPHVFVESIRTHYTSNGDWDWECVPVMGCPSDARFIVVRVDALTVTAEPDAR